MKIALDIGTVAIVALSVFFGVRKGFLKTVIALVGMIAVFFLAYKLSVPLGTAIDNGFMNSSIRSAAASRVADKIGVELQEGDKQAQLEGFETEIERQNDSEEGLSLYGFSGEKIKQAAQEASGDVVKGLFSLVDKFSASVSRVIAAVAIIIAGILLLFLLKLLIKPLLRTLHLGAFDSTLGGLLGAARGVLIVLLIAYALRLALPALGERFTRADIESTLVFKHAYHLVDGE